MTEESDNKTKKVVSSSCGYDPVTGETSCTVSYSDGTRQEGKFSPNGVPKSAGVVATSTSMSDKLNKLKENEEDSKT